MECSACGAVLSPGAKFCSECGEAQRKPTCRVCGEQAAGAGRFCPACGTPFDERLSAQPVPGPEHKPATERRVCSVLFCDLEGFTALSETRDPEEVRELLSRYFQVAGTVIMRYGGALEKFIGDAVMAVWGTPTAQEGDAERAVRAALDVVQEVVELGVEVAAPGLSARAGVVTGEVAVTVGAVGQGMVAGDAVNTAARIQGIARPGEVLVDDYTWRVAQAGIEFTPTGGHQLKGKADPIVLWRAERVLSGVGGVLRIDGLEAPFVGREAELRMVKELFHACAERRSPRLLSVTGMAGVGKSRLGWEFEKYIDGLAVTVWWHRGRCLSYGDGVAFWALAEMVRGRFGIAEDDSTKVAAEKLAAGLQQFLPNEGERAYVGPRLGRLLGVESGEPGSPLGREELFAGWRLFFERLAATRPVVMVMEDLHHADDGMLDFIEHLLDWSRNAPIFVLTFARPELNARRAGWSNVRNSTTLSLEPLDDAAMDRLLDGLVPDMPRVAKQAIAAHAEGMPLYAVETVRMLIDQDVVRPRDGVYRLVGDVGGLAVPPTLHSLLAARLDALDADAVRLIADAAVLGSSFSAESLAAVSGRPLDDVQRLLAELVRREILAVRADPLSPDRGQYGFVQTLFRQVAYQTVGRRDRKERHLAVAEHLRRTFAEGGEEVAQVIAQHLLDALAAVPDDPDAGEITAEAVAMLIRAGERAERTGAAASAATSYVTAAELLERGNASDDELVAARLRERAGDTAGSAGDSVTAVEHFRAAADTYRRHNLTREAAAADAGVGEHLRRQGRNAEARAILNDALATLEADPDLRTVSTLEHLAMLEILTGDPAGDRLSAAALNLAEALGVSDATLAQLFITRATHQVSSGWVQSTASLREAIRCADAAQDGAALCRAMANFAEFRLPIDPHDAAQAAQAAVVHGRRVGDRYMLAFAAATLVEALLFTGEWQLAQSVYEVAAREDGLESDPLLVHAAMLLHALRGDVEAANSMLPVVETLASSETAQDLAIVDTARAAAAFCAGELTAALAHGRLACHTASVLGLLIARWSWSVAVDAALGLDHAAALVELVDWLDEFPIGRVPPLLRAERLRVRACLQSMHDDSGAGPAFERAVQALRDFGSPYHLAVGLLDHAQHCAAAGEAEQAGLLAAEASLIADRLGAEPLRRRAGRIPSVASSQPRAEMSAASD